MIYLDNAATTFPKPPQCLQRALERYLELGASPGRGGYDRAAQAESIVSSIRTKIARFFGAADDARVCFAANATDALNALILGLAKPGDHVVSSRMEHNSVLRPLNHLQKQGTISVDLVPFNGKGYVDPDQIAACFRPETRLVVMTHASNVLGTIQPIEAIGKICKSRGVPLIIDTAQSAGCIPIRMRRWHIQGVAFTGHKSLLGPTGTGGLVISPDIDPEPTRFGGTGFDSRDPLQPMAYPYRLESGTLNLFGILGLDECLDYVEAHRSAFYKQEMKFLQKLRDGLGEMDRISLYGAEDLANHLPVLTCNVDGIAASDTGAILDGDFGIAVRAGLHCAPLVHQDLGTLATGAVRFSPGPFSTNADIEKAVEAMAAIAR
jgi:cysteine desulfurase family protein